MLWFSAAVLFVLTLHAWRTAREMKADCESPGLQTAYLAAAVCGALGTLCFVVAALI
jgi:hypothetical protein